jgi:putative toxin-antitoxin system antitoxin component (TIGR02293 family)
MASQAEREPGTGESAEIERTAALLGGFRVLRQRLRGPLDVHEALDHGLPCGALTALVGAVAVLRGDQTVLERAVGVSLRTSQRFKAAPAKRLSREQSGRVWKFADILAKATAVFGSQDEAEHWLEQPAMGLDQRRPIDLLTTPAGAQLVENFLLRLRYGVYT